MNAPRSPHRSGMALFGVLMLLATLSLIAGTVYTAVQSNLRVTGFHKRQQESFFQANAGLHFVQSKLTDGLQSGTLNLNQSVVPVNISAPSGYTFDTVTNLTRLANNERYLLRVTGRSVDARTTIEAVLGRENAFGNMGIFGDRVLDVTPNYNVYSYDSTVTLNPTPADSTSVAAVGSNESVTIGPGAAIDGTILLGEMVDGTPATISGAGSIPVSRIPRVVPDPLGAIGGPLANSFTHYSSAANNDNAAGGITGNSIDLGNHDTYTLYSGVYYLDEFDLGSHSTLHVESTPSNPAVIFLTGEFRTMPTTTISSTSQSPRALYIFSNSSDEWRVQPNSSFRGIVYAPYADLVVQPNGVLYGIFWGNNVTVRPNGTTYIDMSAMDDFLTDVFTVVHWKEVR